MRGLVLFSSSVALQELMSVSVFFFFFLEESCSWCTVLGVVLVMRAFRC